MTREISEDIFLIQTRLFRQFQIEKHLSVKETEQIFLQYGVFDYIAVCYDFYHVQGDEANLADVFQYLKNQGWQG